MNSQPCLGKDSTGQVNLLGQIPLKLSLRLTEVMRIKPSIFNIKMQ